MGTIPDNPSDGVSGLDIDSIDDRLQPVCPMMSSVVWLNVKILFLLHHYLILGLSPREAPYPSQHVGLL